MQQINSNKQIVEALDEHVAGHQAAKKALAVMLSRSTLRTYQKYVKQMDTENLVKPLKVLLIGSSGTGKTHLVEMLAKIGSFPLVKIDATDLSPSGAGGGTKTSALKTMIREAARDACLNFPLKYPYLEYALESVVLYVDEIDKLGTSFEGSGNWNKHVQSTFLTLFDNKDEFAGVSIIFSGAFTEITKDKVKKVGTSLGFTTAAEEDIKEVLDEQIVKSGIIPELLGRINTIVELDRFTKQDYIDIITQRLLPKKMRDMAAFGVFDLGLTDEDVEVIADKSMKSGQGVRYTQRELDRHFLDVEFNAHWDSGLLMNALTHDNAEDAKLAEIIDDVFTGEI